MPPLRGSLLGPCSIADPQSYVAVVTIPNANAEKVVKTLGTLYHKEGWESKFVGLPSSGSARAVGVVCDRTLGHCLNPPQISLPPSFKPRNISVLVPDRGVVVASRSSGQVVLHPVCLPPGTVDGMEISLKGDLAPFSPFRA